MCKRFPTPMDHLPYLPGESAGSLAPLRTTVSYRTSFLVSQVRSERFLCPWGSSCFTSILISEVRLQDFWEVQLPLRVKLMDLLPRLTLEDAGLLWVSPFPKDHVTETSSSSHRWGWRTSDRFLCPLGPSCLTLFLVSQVRLQDFWEFHLPFRTKLLDLIPSSHRGGCRTSGSSLVPWGLHCWNFFIFSQARLQHFSEFPTPMIHLLDHGLGMGILLVSEVRVQHFGELPITLRTTLLEILHLLRGEAAAFLVSFPPSGLVTGQWTSFLSHRWGCGTSDKSLHL